MGLEFPALSRSFIFFRQKFKANAAFELKLLTLNCSSQWEGLLRLQKCVSVPVIFVRLKAQEKIAKEMGSRMAANNSNTAIGGNNSRVEAWPKIAARIPSRE